MPIDIFISYRRVDSAGYARSVRTGLLRWFDDSRLFFDQETIPAGVEFAPAIADALKQCRVVLVVIGPAWVTVERDGQRRLLDPGDVVRQEVGSALADKKHVIPVLMNGAAMPEAGELPPELTTLASINAHVQGPGKTFDDDLERLARLITERGVTARRQGLDPEREKLPLLCDRSDQHRALSDTVVPMVGHVARRPMVLVLLGHSDEEHWAFVERLETYSMPSLLERTPLSPGDAFVKINDPLPVDCDQGTFARRLRNDIASKLMLGPVDDDVSLLRRLTNDKRSTLVAVLSWHADELDRHAALALQQVHDYWARFPPLGPRMLAACIVCLKYDRAGSAAGRGSLWAKLFGSTRDLAADTHKAGALKAVVEQSSRGFAADPRVVWSAPPELPKVTLADLHRWRDEVRSRGGLNLSSEKLAAVLAGEPRSMEWVLPKLEALVIGS